MIEKDFEQSVATCIILGLPQGILDSSIRRRLFKVVSDAFDDFFLSSFVLIEMFIPLFLLKRPPSLSWEWKKIPALRLHMVMIFKSHYFILL